MKNLIIILSLVLSSCSIHKNAFVQEDLGKEKIVIRTNLCSYERENYYIWTEFSNKIYIYYGEDKFLYIKTDVPEFDDMGYDEEISKFIVQVDSIKTGYNYGTSNNKYVGNLENFGKWKTYFGHDTISNKLYSVTYFRFGVTEKLRTEIVGLENGIRYEFLNKK